MAWHNDIENLIHLHVKPYDKAAPLAHAVEAIAWDVINRQTGQLNRLDEVVDEQTARAEAAEAEVARLREALAAMAEEYERGRGRYGGTGIYDEITAILDATAAAS